MAGDKPQDRMERALIEPETVFGSPENVLSADGYSRREKIEILRQWEYQATEEAVALEEGMPGDDTDLLRRILKALGEIAGPLDMERTSPTKQHGLSRRATGETD
jgi:hypothetical protein